MRSRLPQIVHARRPIERPIELVAALEARRLLAAGPSLSLAQTITVPAGKTIQVPIVGTAGGNGSISYDVAGGSSAGLSTKFHDDSNPTLELETSLGDLQFELLADVAPNTVRKITGLVNAGYYDGLTFHRVVNVNGLQFAQGGDPKQDGTGGPQFAFDDEFDPDAIFSGTGQLATSNTAAGATGKDANGSSFIVTNSAARPFDFNHTIFGQLTRGGRTLSSIVTVPTTGFRPNSAITIARAALVENDSDAVLQVKAGKKLGATTVTVTARDSSGRETTRDIAVNVVNDTSNAPPILKPIAPISAMPGQTVIIPVKAIDLEGEDYDIGGDYIGDEIFTQVDQTRKEVLVRIPDDAEDPIELLLGVKGDNAVSRGNITVIPGSDERYISSGIYDTQRVVISIGDLAVSKLVADEDQIILKPSETLNDARIATFRATGSNIPSASYFETNIDWGDGIVTKDARVREIDEGRFAVYGTHQYDLAGTLPVTIDVKAENGSAARLETTVKVAPELALVGRTLTLTGTEGDDRFTVRLDSNDKVVINDDQSWPAGDIDRIEAYLRGGDDSLDANVSGGLPDLLVDCGSGNDSISAGPGNDIVSGGEGDDQIGGNGGNDLLSAGNGNDTLLGGSGKNVLNGDAGDDRLTGGNGRDLLYAGDGNDRVYGRGGDDVLDAGAGVDRLYGEDGNDLLIGGSGNDRAYGGEGDDVLYGKAGSDILNGGPDKDSAGDDDDNDILIDL
jgi:cyclophilin family peptidyl-prolyl cis-trans isomerase